MALVLVMGGTRSGKSAVAERLVAQAGTPVAYVATGVAGDEEMAARIAAHRVRRPPAWRTIETDDPAAALAGLGEEAVLLDSVGAWIARLLHAGGQLDSGPTPRLDALDALPGRIRRLVDVAAGRPALTVCVCEEAGLGPVPATAGTRRWVDLTGDAAQLLSARAQRTLLVVAGRALELPREPPTVTDADDALRRHGDEMVPPGSEDFAVSVEAGGPPAWLAQALGQALNASVAVYPREAEAVQAVAARHGRHEEEVVLTNGAAEALWLVAAAARPLQAVCVHPSFTEPEAALRAHGRPVARVQRDATAGFALDPGAVPAGADLVVLGNPNNPSGTLDRAEDVARLCRGGRTVVVDEAFMDFVPGEGESLAARSDLPDLVVVRSLTKAYGVPGVRAGYLLAPRPLAGRLRAHRPPWSVNVLALAALRACAERADAAAAVAARVAAARERLSGALARLPGVRTWPSAANFLLTHVSDGRRVHGDLLARGIAVRPCDTFPGLTEDHLRIAVRSPAANDRLVAALAETLR
jgi:histidinol-phosphate aminotransferase